MDNNVVFFEENGEVFLTTIEGDIIYEEDGYKEIVKKLKDGRWVLFHVYNISGKEDTAALVTEQNVVNMLIYNNKIELLKKYFPDTYKSMLVE